MDIQINKYLEHTDLSPSLTDRDVGKLVHEALEYDFLGVCVPPFWVKRVKRDIENTCIHLVTVIGFPLGYQTSETKLGECQQAIDHGANELDIVLNLSAFKSGMSWAKIELAKCSKLLHDQNVLMKVIIETALLTEDEIIKTSKIVAGSGADFVKTSTGFSAHGAKVEHINLIKQSVPSQVGIKASGGIKTYQQAKSMIEAGANRIGTSSSVQIVKGYNA